MPWLKRGSVETPERWPTPITKPTARNMDGPAVSALRRTDHSLSKKESNVGFYSQVARGDGLALITGWRIPNP